MVCRICHQKAYVVPLLLFTMAEPQQCSHFVKSALMIALPGP